MQDSWNRVGKGVARFLPHLWNWHAFGVRTGFIGVVGNEPYGRFCLEDFKRHGVDTSHVVIDMKGETPFTVAISEELTNTRNLISSIGSVRELKPDELDWDYITSAKYLHLEYPTPTSVVAADWAREVGVKVVIDAEQYTPDMIEFIPKVNVFIASEFFYNGMFKDEKYEENCRKILNMGPEIVVFTFGSRGCLGIGPEGFFNIPACEVDVKDTTGAGDVYHGAFIYGLLQKWDTEKTAKFASAVAAIKCTRIGGRAGIPDFNTVMKFMETGVIDYSDIDKRVQFYSKCPVITFD